jgi:pimeloyl-ACP methyl ester carboxylesterase
MEEWQSARVGELLERPVRSDLGVSVALESGSGEAAPLLALPGSGFPAVLLAHRLVSLGAVRRLVAVEVPGHPGLGLTTRPDPREDDLANWATVVLDALGIEKADLFGHSSGGWAALRIAWERPERVRRLVLAAPAGIVRARTPLRLLWRSLRWRVRRDRRGSHRVIESVWGAGEPDPDLVDWTSLLVRNTRMSPPPVALPQPVLRAIEHPLLVLAGELDPVLPAAALRDAAHRVLPNAQIEVVPGAGHVLPIEAADFVVSAAAGFLA